MKFLNTLFILLFSCILFANEAPNDPNKSKYITVTAVNGDGVYSILRKYNLESNSCNRSQFYKINDLTLDSHLKKGKSYKLPILRYDYNGKSIRSTIGIEDWDKAIRIKEYNNLLKELGFVDQSYIDSKTLWVPYHEVHCAESQKSSSKQIVVKADKSKTSSESKTPEGNYIVEDLYGPDLARVKVLDHSLKGKVYYVVSGHGGPDSGAYCEDCPQKMCEDEYAYDVTLRLARNLQQHGATVHVIIQDKNDGIRETQFLKCDHDETSMGQFKMPGSQIRRLEQRAKNINELYKKYKSKGVKEQYAIMIHIDSRSKDRRTDTFFYYFEHGKNGKELATHMQDTFKKKYEYYQKNRGYKGFVKHRNLYMVRNTYPTALYVELANIRNKADQKRLIYPSNRQALANWLFDGLAGFKI